MKPVSLEIHPDPEHDALLQGQPKPTGEQLLWAYAFLCDLWDSEHGMSYGKVMERMFGYPSYEHIAAMGTGQFVTNIINCAKEVPEVAKKLGETYL